ncbi:Cytochrome P450 52A13 [Cytospora mali]|uniref:Cytochrome P450 52A13 n=1 Tax=Cytospora mali TaxID=578113 RepID=A0A194VSN4_CYTMA|nr:Cytochrome P450 52A13 [Valsa mali]
MFTSLIIVATFVFALCLSIKPGSKTPSQCSNVPQLRQKWWLFGFDVAYQFASWVNEKTSLFKSAAWIRENEKTFSVRIAGHTNIWTADALNARAVLTGDSEAFELSHDRQVAFYPVVGRGMIAANGPDWACGKRVIRRCLTKDQVRHLPRYEPHVQNLFKLLPTDGSTVDMREYLLLFAMDVSTDILLGESTFWLTKGTSDEVLATSEALDYCNQVMRLRGDLGFLVYFHWDSKFHRSCKILHNFVEPYITRGNGNVVDPEMGEKTSKSNRPCFLEGLISSIGTKIMVRDHLLTAIMAGRDTTAALMGFTLWSLARDKRVQQKLRDEVAKLQMSLFSYEDLQQVTYLWWTIKEVLRLYPSIPANDRVAKYDTRLPRGGGLGGTESAFIPKGRVIDIHIFAIQRDKEAWGEDAETFRPERWEGLVSPVAFMPFGAGPRTCPGRKYNPIFLGTKDTNQDDRGVSNGADSILGNHNVAGLQLDRESRRQGILREHHY